MTQLSSYFSSDYLEARGKFREACARRSLPVESHLNPREKGARGEELFTDVVRVGNREASKLLVLSSGTHGVEGYCGSGIQVGLLEQGYFDDLPDELSVLMIHAVNPYGFSHNRRVNEDNIDLNRNFVSSIVGNRPKTRYAEVHPFLVPDDWEGPAKTKADQAIQKFIALNGYEAFQAAVSGGQYDYSDGLFYGGTEEAWSWRMLRAVLTEHGGDAELVGFIDVHTGLGPYGFGELISLGAAQEKQRAVAWYQGQVTDPDAGTSTSAMVTGTLGHGIPEILPRSETVFIALEYGTYAFSRVLEAHRADNWLYQKGEVDSDLGRAIKKELRDTMYPDMDDWKTSVWARALEVIHMAINGLTRSY